MNYRKVLVVVAIMACLWSSNLRAQTASGSISGTVSDQSGAVVPGVKVTVTDVDTGVSRDLETDAGGRYQTAALPPGNYQVQAQKEGFQTELRKGIQLTVGSELAINITLKIGQVAQTAIVTAEAPLVETLSGTVSGLVDDRAIRDLPLNGRSFDQLVALNSSTPIYHMQVTGSSAASVGRSDVFSISGQKPESNVYLMDGTEVVGASYTSVVPGGALGINMGVEAIQEFSVLTSDYSAAYGKRSGGVINIATRSGTNALHGSVYEFLRNSDFDARNFFSIQKPPFRQNQFGVALGGPIRKDKTFFFGNYEGLRQVLGLSNIAVVPDNNARLGLLPVGQNGTLVNVGLAPAVVPYLATWPQANGPDYGDGTAEYIASPTQISHQDFFLVRVDHRISDKDALFVRYSYSNASLLEPDLNSLFATTQPSRDHGMTIQEIRTYPTFQNIARFGFDRSTLYNADAPVTPLPSSLNFFPSAHYMGAISLSTSSAAVSAITPTGTAASSPRDAVINQFEGNDQVYYYLGAHALQFGVKYERIQHNTNNGTGTNGTYSFPSLESFLQGTGGLFTGPDPTGGADATKGYRQHYFGTFIQDDWKVRRNFTLNLGMRWEFMTSPTDATDRLSNYVVDQVNGLPVLDTNPQLGGPLYHTDFSNVAPRLGFAWDIFGDGKTAVRGGFGMYYDQIETAPMSTLSSNPPYFDLVQIKSAPFPQGFSGGAGSLKAPAPNGIDPNSVPTTAFNYNFGIERQITTNTIFKVSYVGSHTYHLMTQWEANTVVPEILPGNVFYFSSTSPRLNPALGSSRYESSQGDANYNALEIDLIQRYSHALRYKLSYTFSKNLDDADASSGPQSNNTAPQPQNPWNILADYGLSGFNIAQSFGANFTYDLPGQNIKGMAGRVVGGWQAGSILTLTTGFPFQVETSFNQSDNGDTANTSDRPSLAPGASNNPVLGGPNQYYNPKAFLLPPLGFYGNLGRDTVIGPGFATVDFTLVKMIPISERFKLNFRAEFFNILNRANFGLPNQNVFNSNGSYVASAGQITTTTSSPREIQFALKLLF